MADVVSSLVPLVDRSSGVVTGTVAALWRFPVKSAAGEALQRVTIHADGPVGDRLWGVLDHDGTVVSAKHPRLGGRLLHVATSYDDASGATWLRVPGAGFLAAGAPDADEALSGWLGRPVRLSADVPAGLRLRRRWPTDSGLIPDWERAQPGADAVTDVTGAARHRRFVDFGAVHAVTRSALARLSAANGDEVAALRFRPNLVVDGIDDPHPEATIAVGGAVLRHLLPTPRCVVPGLAHHELPEDRALLRTVARHDRRPVGRLGTAACFGFYCSVEREGDVAVGDAVRVVS